MNLLTIALTVNGQPVSRQAPAEISLADFLHEKVGLTGTKVACGMGLCKACTVAVRGPDHAGLQRLQACITPAAAVAGWQVLTVEGLSAGGVLSAAQAALLRNFSFQCGYCAPGFLMGIVLLLDALKAQPVPRHRLDEAIQTHLGEHICRCTGYARYHLAVRQLLEQTPGRLL